uniref:Prefoldin subunit 3 n=1 Tax=Sarcophilus harrisii TaxID=9305 RepID=A0A7N4PHW9_SARHA
MATTKEPLSGSDSAGPSTCRGHLGIPEAVFVEDVDAFMKQPGNESVDNVLKKLDEQYQKYKFMELNLTQKKKRLKNQIPEIKQTLHILKYIFLLADNLYCKASVPPTDKVCLWLGMSLALLMCNVPTLGRGAW